MLIDCKTCTIRCGNESHKKANIASKIADYFSNATRCRPLRRQAWIDALAINAIVYIITYLSYKKYLNFKTYKKNKKNMCQTNRCISIKDNISWFSPCFNSGFLSRAPLCGIFPCINWVLDVIRLKKISKASTSIGERPPTLLKTNYGWSFNRKNIMT